MMCTSLHPQSYAQNTNLNSRIYPEDHSATHAHATRLPLIRAVHSVKPSIRHLRFNPTSHKRHHHHPSPFHSSQREIICKTQRNKARKDYACHRCNSAKCKPSQKMVIVSPFQLEDKKNSKRKRQTFPVLIKLLVVSSSERSGSYPRCTLSM